MSSHQCLTVRKLQFIRYNILWYSSDKDIFRLIILLFIKLVKQTDIDYDLEKLSMIENNVYSLLLDCMNRSMIIYDKFRQSVIHYIRIQLSG